ncbi:DMT family transporter [Ktedonosporobacter rubrisoli]|uniref:DMT family transporter n=1 Tax=Ktedonosporobacter rubrisoli TaxID=2509675 RepID=A0A4V0YY90_KTERU|nr:DMT family transporter [Ktedonosporobacter rubrisoli]QBD75391.1 DMT family transporter [Ktedonosporobacter rubrisoli]
MNKLKMYAAMAMAMVLAGSTIVTSKIITNHVPVFLNSELRFGMATLLYLPLILLYERKRQKLNGRDLLLLFLQTLGGVFIFSVFSLYGLRLTSAAEGGIITSTTPIVVALLALLFLGEKLNRARAGAIGIAFLGLVVINTNGAASGQGSNALLGNLLLFGAVLGESMFTIVGKASRISPLLTSALVAIFGCILFLPFALIEGTHFSLAQISVQDWLIIGYNALSTPIAYILWFYGIRHVPGSTAAIFTAFIPLSAVPLAALLLHEPVTWQHWLGFAFILAGIGLCMRESKQAEGQPEGPTRSNKKGLGHVSFPRFSRSGGRD